jgi:RNA polymerase sigma factor (sigma-70 family)
MKAVVGSERSFPDILREVLEGKESMNALLEHPEFRRRGGKVCAALQQDQWDTEELFQDTCVKLLKYPSFKFTRNNIPDENAFFSWFYVIAQNIVRDKIRREKKSPRASIPLEQISVPDLKVNLEDKSLISEFMGFSRTLPDPHRLAILCWLEGSSVREINKILNNEGVKCSHVTIQKWIKDAFINFRERNSSSANKPFIHSQMRKDISIQTTFTDQRDGYSYNIVKLRDGNLWLAENLRYEMPGSFPADEKPDEQILATNPEYDWKKYGRLYTWEAAKKAPPPGWHLPSDREWKKMLNAYGGYGHGLGAERHETGRDDIKVLMQDELRVKFGGFLNTADWPNSESPQSEQYAYTYYQEMLGKFWSTAKQFSFSIRGGIYYRFDMRGRVCRDAENVEKAFSVRCIKD